VPDMSDLKAVGLFEQWASVEQNQWDPSVVTLVVQQLFNPYVSRYRLGSALS